jgi:5-methylcytosine-specific restriction endonuclease McrA
MVAAGHLMRVNTRRGRAENQRILRTNNVCHLCGHPGADAIDHVIPLARGGPDTVTNKKPAHHKHPCPTCGIKCNHAKGARLIAPVTPRSGALNR